ncbi:MAG: hypothetical protein IJW25_00220 [Clostridia bacterium]|nr:hypothetical protein [Clostridia bacterium]
MGDYDAISANALETIKKRQREMYFDIKTQLENIRELNKARNTYLDVLTEQNEEMLELKRKEIEQKERELILHEKEVKLLERQLALQVVFNSLDIYKVYYDDNDNLAEARLNLWGRGIDCTEFADSAMVYVKDMINQNFIIDDADKSTNSTNEQKQM